MWDALIAGAGKKNTDPNRLHTHTITTVQEEYIYLCVIRPKVERAGASLSPEEEHRSGALRSMR